jgi:hypothetical protein
MSKMRTFATALMAAGFVALVPALSFAGGDDERPIPDLTGHWGRNAFNFEPMPTGPRPLVNLERLPDGTNDRGVLVGDYRNPLLKPEAAKHVKELGEYSLSGHAYPDPSNQCQPYAPPFTFAMQLGFELLQKKDGVTFLYNQDDQIRHVRLNAAHPKNPVPSAMGDSVAHYDGDTLVIDTVAIENGPYSMVDRWGTPHSKALHVIERYRLIDGATAIAAQKAYEEYDGRIGGKPGAMALEQDPTVKGLQLEVTVEDPAVFTSPWSAYVTYRRAVAPWEEQVCAENPANYYEGMSNGFPRAEKPDF